MAEHTDVAAYEHNGATVSAAHFYTVACDPRRHVAVEACAGAGKTWMLVSRIVRALFDGLDDRDGRLAVQPHDILAITFTKRAASEMRERLYKWLQDFAGASQERLLRELRDRGVAVPTDAAAAEGMARRLAGLQQAVLQCPRQVQIRTFHSWFAALLRAAPIAVLQQLKLPLQYELLEDDAPAKALVWRRFYQALIDQPERQAAFEAVVRTHGRFQTEKALGVALDKRIEFARADAAGRVEPAVRHFHDVFPALAALASPADAVMGDGARTRWLAWSAALGRELNKTPQKAAQAIVDAFAQRDGAPAGDPDAAATCLAALRKALFVEKEDRLNTHLLKFDAAQAAAAELAQLCAAQRHHGAWQYQQHLAGLARVLIDAFAALKHERGWIDMTDVERAAMTLLSDPQLSGWVQERLDTRVRHLLIDEFQDTNPLQWHALLSWLGSYAGATGQRPSVFIVGDPKQSIYRFRRAEPQVFLAAQDFVATGLGGDLLRCDHTRRNAPGIIGAVNQVMLAARDDDGYDGFRAHTTGADAAGQVLRLPPIARDRAAEEERGGNGPPAWRDSLTQPRDVPEETLRSLEARQVARWIAQQVAQQGLAASDVMVLSRRRASLMPLQDELRALQIPAHVGENTALIDCCEVQDIVALLDVLVSSRHDLSMARVLRSPLFDAPDQALVDLAVRRRAQPDSWFALLQQPWPRGHALHGIGARLLAWKDLLDRLPPHDAMQAIYSQHDVLARFAVRAPEVQRAAVLANLRALLAASLQVAGGRFVTPYAFVRALKAGGVQAPATVTADAVRLLTVHGAKGLEADVVVLLDTDTPPRAAETMGVLIDWPAQEAHPRQFFFVSSEANPPQCAQATRDHELQQRQREELNALYVALTRARNTLVVSSIEPHREAPGSWWRRLFDVASPMPAAADMAGVPTPAELAPDGMFTLKILPPGPPPDARTPVETPPVDPALDLLARVGQAMHRLLEWGAVDLQAVAAVRREFALDAEAADRAATMARSILAGPGAWAWDAAQLSWQGNEVELVSDGAVLRLDRLVQRRDNGQWWVLDHKSNLAPLRDPALVAQLARYRAAVRAIDPAQVVHAAFLNGQGEWIDLPETPAVLP
ncbi:UvrD-helicase domain-containing protein [Comamonadaceae bacterium G21597-S1]|nr:UvrD-helicase domain-containing protein [Comamonadaceae bacterium G21597-S1]